MNEPVNKRTIAVGLFIVIGILCLVGGILTIGNLHSTFSRKMTVSTVFGNVNGLVAGNNIWFSGVKIGTVKSISFFGKSDVKVEMNINIESRQYIRRDAKVRISTDGLIGNKILVIYGGTPAYPEIEEGDNLSGEVLLNTEDIMATLQRNNLNILTLTQKLADGKGTIGKLLNNDSLYYSIAAITQSLQQASVLSKEVMGSLADFSSKLNDEGSLVNDLVTDTAVFNSISATVHQLQTIADTAALMVNNLKEVAENPNSPAGVLLRDEQAGSNLKVTLDNLEKSSEKLNQDLEAIQHNFLLRRYFKKQAKEKGN